MSTKFTEVFARRTQEQTQADSRNQHDLGGIKFLKVDQVEVSNGKYVVYGFDVESDKYVKVQHALDKFNPDTIQAGSILKLVDGIEVDEGATLKVRSYRTVQKADNDYPFNKTKGVISVDETVEVTKFTNKNSQQGETRKVQINHLLHTDDARRVYDTQQAAQEIAKILMDKNLNSPSVIIRLTDRYTNDPADPAYNASNAGQVVSYSMHIKRPAQELVNYELKTSKENGDVFAQILNDEHLLEQSDANGVNAHAFGGMDFINEITNAAKGNAIVEVIPAEGFAKTIYNKDNSYDAFSINTLNDHGPVSGYMDGVLSFNGKFISSVSYDTIEPSPISAVPTNVSTLAYDEFPKAKRLHNTAFEEYKEQENFSSSDIIDMFERMASIDTEKKLEINADPQDSNTIDIVEPEKNDIVVETPDADILLDAVTKMLNQVGQGVLNFFEEQRGAIVSVYSEMLSEISETELTKRIIAHTMQFTGAISDDTAMVSSDKIKEIADSIVSEYQSSATTELGVDEVEEDISATNNQDLKDPFANFDMNAVLGPAVEELTEANPANEERASTTTEQKAIGSEAFDDLGSNLEGAFDELNAPDNKADDQGVGLKEILEAAEISHSNEEMKTNASASIGGTSAKGGVSLIGRNGLMSAVQMSKANPETVYTISADNYTNDKFPSHWLKNGKLALKTVANENVDFATNNKNMPRENKIKDVIFKVSTVIKNTTNKAVEDYLVEQFNSANKISKDPEEPIYNEHFEETIHTWDDWNANIDEENANIHNVWRLVSTYGSDADIGEANRLYIRFKNDGTITPEMKMQLEKLAAPHFERLHPNSNTENRYDQDAAYEALSALVLSKENDHIISLKGEGTAIKHVDKMVAGLWTNEFSETKIRFTNGNLKLYADQILTNLEAEPQLHFAADEYKAALISALQNNSEWENTLQQAGHQVVDAMVGEVQEANWETQARNGRIHRTADALESEAGRIIRRISDSIIAKTCAKTEVELGFLSYSTDKIEEIAQASGSDPENISGISGDTIGVVRDNGSLFVVSNYSLLAKKIATTAPGSTTGVQIHIANYGDSVEKNKTLRDENRFMGALFDENLSVQPIFHSDPAKEALGIAISNRIYRDTELQSKITTDYNGEIKSFVIGKDEIREDQFEAYYDQILEILTGDSYVHIKNDDGTVVRMNESQISSIKASLPDEVLNHVEVEANETPAETDAEPSNAPKKRKKRSVRQPQLSPSTESAIEQSELEFDYTITEPVYGKILNRFAQHEEYPPLMRNGRAYIEKGNKVLEMWIEKDVLLQKAFKPLPDQKALRQGQQPGTFSPEWLKDPEKYEAGKVKYFSMATEGFSQTPNETAHETDILLSKSQKEALDDFDWYSTDIKTVFERSVSNQLSPDETIDQALNSVKNNGEYAFINEYEEALRKLLKKISVARKGEYSTEQEIVACADEDPQDTSNAEETVINIADFNFSEESDVPEEEDSNTSETVIDIANFSFEDEENAKEEKSSQETVIDIGNWNIDETPNNGKYAISDKVRSGGPIDKKYETFDEAETAAISQNALTGGSCAVIAQEENGDWNYVVHPEVAERNYMSLLMVLNTKDDFVRMLDDNPEATHEALRSICEFEGEFSKLNDGLTDEQYEKLINLVAEKTGQKTSILASPNQSNFQETDQGDEYDDLILG